MDRPGEYDLGSVEITTALTGSVITSGVNASGVAQALVDRLEGMTSLSLECLFTYGSGGTSCIVTVQTTLDQGATWIDLARFDFSTATAKKIVNLSGETPVGVTSVAALSSEGVLDGVLGPRLRAVVTSTGTYAGSTSAAVRAVAR